MFNITILNQNGSTFIDYTNYKNKDKMMLWWLTIWLIAIFIIFIWKIIDFIKILLF